MMPGSLQAESRFKRSTELLQSALCTHKGYSVMAYQKVNGNAESVTLLLYTIASILRQQDVDDQFIPKKNFMHCKQHCEALHRREQVVTNVAAGSPAPPPRSKQRARKKRRDLAQLLVQSDPVHLPIYEPLSQPPRHGAHRNSAPLVTAHRSGDVGYLSPGSHRDF